MHKITASILIVALTFICSRQASAEEKSAKWMEMAEKGAFCNEGSIQLAYSGVQSLPLLESWYSAKTDNAGDRIDSILNMALLQTIQPSDLDAYPNLSRIAQAHYKEAEPFVEILRTAPRYDSGEIGFRPSGANPPEPSKERQAFRALLDMRGFAVKPALQLIDTPSPFAKAYGVQILLHVEAMSQLPKLLALRSDTNKISVFHGDYFANPTIGEMISESLRLQSHFAAKLDSNDPNKEHAPVFEAEQYVSELCEGMDSKRYTGSFIIINALRQEAKTFESKSWDDYWSKAGPVIEQIYMKSYKKPN